MKSRIYTFLLLGLTMLLSACEHDDPEVERGTRTVLAYIMADNSLSNFATADIDEMVEGMKQVNGSNSNLLIYADGRSSTPKLYHVTKNKKGEVMKEVIMEYEESISTDAVVMQEVMQRAFSEYPADSYGMIIWSHGDGWVPNPLPAPKRTSTRWIGQDTTNGTHYLNITDMASVFKNLSYHLDFILFDACFGQTIEVAYELRNYTDYIIGSPTEIPGPGAAYDKVVPAMFVAANVGIEIAKAYYEPYAEIYDESVAVANNKWTGGVSVAVVKCAALEELASVTKQLLRESAPDLTTLHAGIYNYDKRKGNSLYDYVGYYDMKQLMQQLSADASAWNAAANKAILSWRTTPMNFSSALAKNNQTAMDGRFAIPQETTCGVSHYIPASTTSSVAAAYRSTAWYTAAGLDKLGW